MDEAPSSDVEELATPTGLEPVISAVTGRRVNHYTKGPDARDENPRTPPERFTSLVPNPAADKEQGIQTKDHIRSVSVQGAELSDNSIVRERQIARRQFQREDAQMRCVYSVIDHMLEDLVLTDGERQRLRGGLLAQMWNDVSIASIVASAEVLS